MIEYNYERVLKEMETNPIFKMKIERDYLANEIDYLENNPSGDQVLSIEDFILFHGDVLEVVVEFLAQEEDEYLNLERRVK